MFGYQPVNKATATRLGRLNFILQFGILRWALPMAVMLAFIRISELGTATFPREFALALTFYVPGFAIVAAITWNHLMKSDEPVAEPIKL